MSKFTVKNLNKFLLFKLPSAYISGVRVKSINENEAIATVKHKWINQNPFKSLYWATQGMASELATGILVMKQIDESGKKISMLVTKQTGTFTKKATGRINFICKDGHLVKQTIDKTIASGKGETLTMTAEGFDEEGDLVSKFEYEWGIKIKSQ
ncbi:DUF4442 domain-containing protein [Aureibaculum marinum]|uniref:DUF4442 domain-containing protein n=1 Tax=Aureibaculum marinum TaxID=2487930 RepID=A0A3N4P551_9FLAO|nr:DUF4442 domain-containing protein [Aureibaculum marinum]RPE00017.1 DUF4442 domain-containing protein [Aureibaculum marinum]